MKNIKLWATGWIFQFNKTHYLITLFRLWIHIHLIDGFGFVFWISFRGGLEIGIPLLRFRIAKVVTIEDKENT